MFEIVDSPEILIILIITHVKPTCQNFIFFFFFSSIRSATHNCSRCKTSRVLSHRRIISRRSRVTHATASRYFMSSLSLLHRLASPVLFLRRASRHALFSINAVPLRDTSHVSRVTLCRFRGISYYIGVISCLVTFLRPRDSSPLSSRKTPLAVRFSCRLTCRSRRLSYLISSSYTA